MPSGSQEATPETPPDAAAPEPVAAPQENVIPTGFPEGPTVVPEQPTRSRPGYVTLATHPPVGALTIPPLKRGGEAVTITADGTEVDDATAARAREAALLAGFSLREL